MWTTSQPPMGPGPGHMMGGGPPGPPPGGMPGPPPNMHPHSHHPPPPMQNGPHGMMGSPNMEGPPQRIPPQIPPSPGTPELPVHRNNIDPYFCGPPPVNGPPSSYYRPMPIPRRATSYFQQPDYRIYELNKRLSQRNEESDNLWWDAFANEFFEDDATLTLSFCLEDGLKRYTIGRTLIPRYFRSIFEGGVTELSYNVKHPKESFHNTSITLDCDQCTMITVLGKSGVFTQVCTEGKLILEFTFDEMMRMKSWHFAVRNAKELIMRSALAIHAQQQDPGSTIDMLSKNVTRQGLTNSTLNYLRLCVILEPMQELMSRHKAYALSPRDCLKTTLFQKWQRMVAPPETARPQSKRRKRKGSNSTGGGGPGGGAPPVSKKRSPGPSFSLASQDVMVVGEPSLMGGECGDEDERLITRLENSQYDASAADTEPFGAESPLPGAGPNSWAPPQDRPPHGSTPTSQDSDKKSPAVSQ